MANSTTTTDLVARNKALFTAHPPHHPTLASLPSLGYTAPQILIIACADPRCVPEHILGLKPLEAVVIRNPCGHVAPNLPGLLALDCLIGGFREVMVIHHTDCGASMYTDDGTRAALRAATGTRRSLAEVAFGAIDTHGVAGVQGIVQSVRDDLARLREEPLVRPALKDKVAGFVYDIETGLLTNVEE